MITQRIFNRMRMVGTTACAIAALALAGCGPVYERSDFLKEVQNKSEAEVQKALGKPASIDASNPDRVVWTYTGESFDLANGNKRDSKQIVVFARVGDKLMVTDVQFEH
jgi:hypothetical protein